MKILLFILAFALSSCVSVETKPDEHNDPKYVDCYTNDGGQHIKQFPAGLVYIQYVRSEGVSFEDPKDHCFK